jgi:hypothetical protein
MKKILVFCFLVLFSFNFNIYAQTLQHYKIPQIKELPNDSIVKKSFKSLLHGQKITTEGVVMIRALVDPQTNRKPIIWRGPRWSIYIQDTSRNDWNGLLLITDSLNNASLLDLVDTNYYIKVTGTVDYFSSSGPQFNVDKNVQIEILGVVEKKPEPIELTLADFMNADGTVNPFGIKYQGSYVIFRNLVSSNKDNSNQRFRINDESGRWMQVYDQSGYFTSRTHKLRTFSAPQDGSRIEYIKGYIEWDGSYFKVIPGIPEDLKVSQAAPVISSLTRNIAVPKKNDNIIINANIQDPDGQIVESKLYYRINGGSYNSVNMTLVSGIKYQATIPAIGLDSALVDYFITAKDNDNLITRYPIDTVKNKFFFIVLERELKISDIQYSPFGSGYGGFTNYYVDVKGVVVCDTSISRNPLKVYLQDGNSPWSGIRLVVSPAVANLKLGDRVKLKGKVIENYNLTMLDSVSNIVVLEQGVQLPQPVQLSTSTIATKSDGTVDAEKYESMWISYSNITVTNENADGPAGGTPNYGEMLVADSSGIATRVELQEGIHKYHNLWDQSLLNNPAYTYVKQGDKFNKLSGILYFSFSNYKLIPLRPEDFIGYTSSVKKQDNNILTYNLSQNYPNPFNPTTSIEFSLPKSSYVSLKVYDILGKEVASLVGENLSAGSYKAIFDATNLKSGIYVYVLKAGEYFEAKKMTLLK